MKNNRIFVLIFLCILISCANSDRKREQAAGEIRETENSFALMAEEQGIREAFLHFADVHAVLHREGRLIIGIDSIEAYLASHDFEGVKLSWSPDFVEVAASLDLGYTYGKYTWSYLDSTHTAQAITGIFHTVWKRQKDGTWRFVWD